MSQARLVCVALVIMSFGMKVLRCSDSPSSKSVHFSPISRVVTFGPDDMDLFSKVDRLKATVGCTEGMSSKELGQRFGMIFLEMLLPVKQPSCGYGNLLSESISHKLIKGEEWMLFASHMEKAYLQGKSLKAFFIADLVDGYKGRVLDLPYREAYDYILSEDCEKHFDYMLRNSETIDYWDSYLITAFDIKKIIEKEVFSVDRQYRTFKGRSFILGGAAFLNCWPVGYAVHAGLNSLPFATSGLIFFGGAVASSMFSLKARSASQIFSRELSTLYHKLDAVEFCLDTVYQKDFNDRQDGDFENWLHG